MGKKSLSILLLLLFVFSLTACQKEDLKDKIEIDSSSVETIPTEPSKTPGVVPDNSTAPLPIVTPDVPSGTPTDPSNVLTEPLITGNINIEFVDVGQGDSSFIITENNDVILIDTSDKKDAAALLKELDKYEFEDIDLMILSHPHADHIRGTEKILDTYDVKTVIMSSYVATSKLFESILDSLSSKDIDVIPAKSDLELEIDGVNIDILASDLISSDCNNSSIITKITYGDVDVLYTGDMEKSAESKLLDLDLDLNSEILKVGHHGSDTSTSIAFLREVSPDYAVISVGEGNKYKHPSDSVISLLNNEEVIIYRTDVEGTISFVSDGKNIEIKK